MFSLNIYKICIVFLCFYFVKSDDITSDVFGNDVLASQYLPAAFGDFNADKLTDIFVIEKSKNESYAIKILLSYPVSPFIRFTGPQCLFYFTIVSLVPSDFDGDGAMDIMVLSYNNGDGFYESRILWGDFNDLICNESQIPFAKFKAQPLLMDYNGDMISDVFGEDIDGKRSFWVFNKHRRKPMRIIMEYSDNIILPLSPLQKWGGNAFVDLDQDYAADMWISAEGHFEFWPSLYDFQEYELVSYPEIKGETPYIVGQSAFADIDLDGSIEVILPVCSDAYCSESFLYVYEYANKTSQWYNLKVNFKDSNEDQWSFPAKKESFLYTNTISPRIGDLNLDGYPDILITMFNGNTPKVILLINSECKTDCEYPRTLVPEWNTFDAWPNSVLGTFFDYLEDGNLDVLIVNASADKTKYSLGAYKNSVEYDAMFLKVLVLTGTCYNDCKFNKIPYGTNLPGPAITYSMISSDGGIQTALAGQMSQTSHFALQLPFTLFGLGRNWNFIEELRVGIPLLRPASSLLSNDTNYIDAVILPNHVLEASFTQIIPNSQLVVIPYPIDKPSSWITKLFITPSKAMIMTAGALIATCLFVGAIIGGLHVREKQQDKQEKRQQAQRFHFDAM